MRVCFVMRSFMLFIFGVIVTIPISTIPQVALGNDQVIIYTSVDQEFSEPILKQFEKQTSILVKAVYDAEASKTVGLERRLLSEKSRPRADVFWNSEYLRTFKLAASDILMPYTPEASKSIPDTYSGPARLWAGFGIRARVFIVNNELVQKNKVPEKLFDLIDPKWKSKVAIAKPYFGTTSTHFAALYAKMGGQKYIDFLKALKANDVAILPGNSDVRDAVVAGKYVFGLTDTDDVSTALAKNDPVTMVFLDQDKEGSFEVFHTVSLIKDGPNPENAQKLIDYLTSAEVENELIKSGAVQISVRASGNGNVLGDQPVLWHVDAQKLMAALEPSAKLIRTYLE